MRVFTLSSPDDFDGWRDAARQAWAEGLGPEDVEFANTCDQTSLLGTLDSADGGHRSQSNGAGKPVVPKEFPAFARQVICHSEPARFSLLYSIFVRLQKDKSLLRKTVDPEVHRANALAKEVRRDMHKMKAFVRFRKSGELPDGTEQFVAWFEPSHHIVRATTPFFMRRFTGMQWSILTPGACAHWDGKALTFSGGVPKSSAPTEDALEDYWQSYYASIFNPARLKINAMTSEMPKKYWKNLPEASLIPGLIHKSQARERAMIDSEPSLPKPGMMAHREISQCEKPVPPAEIHTIEQLNDALRGCQACPLWKPATQAVCGTGKPRSGLMLVGKQPGDTEDLQGKPFVRPAGKLLSTIMAERGIADAYMTNAVKHFKFEPRGKRRLHKTPTAPEIDHCRWWLSKEIEIIRPKVIVALGASAIRGVLGKSVPIAQLRGTELSLPSGATLIATRHPASILRARSEREKNEARAQLADDLSRARTLINRTRAAV